jgi:hypothetical protein
MDTVREFRKRTSLLWGRARVWLFLCIPAIIGLSWTWGYIEIGPTPRFWVFLVSLGYLVLAFAVCVFAVQRFYRCPQCEEVLMDGTGGTRYLLLFPPQCPNCGARLR